MRYQEVQGQLAKVVDPELDQPLTELGFIGGVAIEGTRVGVQFRLPTFWCAPNFAYLMAVDIRARVSELPWVERVDVRLEDHAFDAEITAGVNGGRTFEETFPGLATDGLEELRETFRVKAFLARQERLFRALLALGWQDGAILGLRVGDLADLPLGPEEAAVLARYRAVLEERGLGSDATAPAFVRPDGRGISVAECRAYLAHAQRTRLSTDFNTAACRGLFQTRYCERASTE